MGIYVPSPQIIIQSLGLFACDSLSVCVEKFDDQEGCIALQKGKDREKWGKKYQSAHGATSEGLPKKQDWISEPPEFLTKGVVSPRSTSKGSSDLSHC